MDQFFTLHTRINSKWIRYLKVKVLNYTSKMRKHGVMAEFFYIQRKAKFFSNHENKILHMHNKKKNDKMGHSICNSID